MSRPSLNELIDAADKIFNVCYRDVPILAGQTLTLQQTYVLAVYNMMIELASGVLTAMKQEQSVCCATLLRSLMEYFVELLYLINNPNDIDKLLANSQEEFKKFIEGIDACNDDTFSEIKGDRRFKETVDKLKESVNNKDKLSIYARFKDAGIVDWFTRYRHLSAIAHPNFFQYVNSHITVGVEGVSKFNLNGKRNRDESEVWISTLAEILIASTLEIHKLFPDGDPDVMQGKFNTLTDIWKQYNLTDSHTATPDNNINL